MKAFVALCLFIAYLPGCTKISTTQRDNNVASEPSLKNETGPTDPFPSNGNPTAPFTTVDHQALQTTDTVREPSSALEKPDNSQLTRRWERSNHNRLVTKEEFLNRIAPRLSRSSADLPVKHGPEGQVLIDLNGRFSHVSLARKMPDGTIRHTCIDSVKGVKAWLSAGERPAKQ